VRRQFHLSPRELRSLVVLLLLLPLAPAGLLARAMIISAVKERQEIREVVRENQRSLGDALIRTAIRRTIPTPERVGPPTADGMTVDQHLLDIARRVPGDGLIILGPNLQFPNDSMDSSPELEELAKRSLEMIARTNLKPADLADRIRPGVWTVPEGIADTNILGLSTEAHGNRYLFLRERDALFDDVNTSLVETLEPGTEFVGYDDSGAVVVGKEFEQPEDLQRLVSAVGPQVPVNEIHYLERIEIFEEKTSMKNIQLSYYIAGFTIIGVTLVTVLAGWAVTRQLRLNEIQNDSLATVAHELKTPIASSRVMLESLATGSVSGEEATEEYLGLLQQENTRLQDLAENFLTHSKLESGGMAINPAPIDVGELLGSIATRFQPRAAERDGTLHLDVPEQSIVVNADRSALSRLLGCLLDNALKYSEGAPKIVLGATSASIDHGTTPAVEITVADRGIGIPKEELSRVFDKFHQVDQRLSRGRGGCGLGLAIAQRLAIAHGGSITALGNPAGEGSVFRVVLPLQSRSLAKN